MVDIILVILALAVMAALVVMRRNPKANAQPQVRSAVPPTAEPRQPGGRLAAALAATPQRPPVGVQPPMAGPQLLPVGLQQSPATGLQQAPAVSNPPAASPVSPAASPAVSVASVPAGGMMAPLSFPAPPSPAPQGSPTTLLSRESTAYLEVVAGESAGQHFPLAPGDNRIGRGPNNRLRLPDHTVSNQHAIVRLVPGQVLLFDDSSTNGTYVNGQRVLQPRPITHGDRITVGQTVLQLHLEPDEAPGLAG